MTESASRRGGRRARRAPRPLGSPAYADQVLARSAPAITTTLPVVLTSLRLPGSSGSQCPTGQPTSPRTWARPGWPTSAWPARSLRGVMTHPADLRWNHPPLLLGNALDPVAGPRPVTSPSCREGEW